MSVSPKHPLIESLVLFALVFYLAMAVTALVGLVSWMLGGQNIVLDASWVYWCATIAIVPLALRLAIRPRARFIFDRYRTWMADWLKHRRVKLSCKEQLQDIQKEQRQYARCHVEYTARVATDHGTSGFGMIADLSLNGCRVKSKTMVAPGDLGKLLIYLPTAITPLTVSLTSVRWVSGRECGLEFLLMDLDEQGCLNRSLNRAQSQPDPVVAVVS